jgi:hypothetical protein
LGITKLSVFPESYGQWNREATFSAIVRAHSLSLLQAPMRFFIVFHAMRKDYRKPASALASIPNPYQKF